MGLINNFKKSLKNATKEKTNFGKSERQDSLSEGITRWISDKNGNQQKIIHIAMGVACAVLIVGVMGWNFYKVYVENDGASQSLGTLNSSKTNSQTSNLQSYSSYFENLDAWTFLDSNKENVAYDLYRLLLQNGMESSSTVYCFSTYTFENDAYKSYVRESSKSKYFQVNITTAWEVSIEETTSEKIQEALTPKVESTGSESSENTNENNSSNESSSSSQSITDTSSNILLSETSRLKSVLPEDCVSLISSSLLKGIKQSYNFDALLEASSINPETVQNSDNSVIFDAQFIDENHNQLLVNITYDKNNKTFSGEKKG